MKRKTKTRKKMTETQLLERECHDLWSKCVRERDNHICRFCGTEHVDKATTMSGHHIRTKRNHPYTRYMIENGLCLCFRCHSGEKYQHERFMDEIINVIGQPEYDRLKEISNTNIKYSISDLEEIKRRLTEELRHLQ